LDGRKRAREVNGPAESRADASEGEFDSRKCGVGSEPVLFSHAMEGEGGGFRKVQRQRREGSVDFGGEGWKGSVGIFGPVRSKEMVVDQVDEDWSKAAVRRRDSADALADSRMAIRKGVDAVMAGNAALNLG